MSSSHSTSASSNSLTSPFVFRGQDWLLWSQKVQAYCRALGYWDAVEDTMVAIPSPGPGVTLTFSESLTLHKLEQEQRDKKAKALGTLHCFMSDQLREKHAALDTPKLLWDT